VFVLIHKKEDGTLRSGRSTKSVSAGFHLLVMVLACTAVRAQTPSYSTTRTDPPKAEGAVRIGLITPKVTLLGGGGTGTQEVSSLRKDLISYLTGPRLGTIELKARLDSLAFDESKERSCDYVLYTSMTRKRKPSTGTSGGYGSGTKVGDEFTFEYRVVATESGQPPVENVLRGTVKADGEDVLTPMIESAAQAIVNMAKAAAPKAVHTATNAPTPNPEPVATPTNANPVSTSSPSTPTGYGSLSAPTPSARNRTTSTTVSDPPKAEGTIRIGLVVPRVSSVGSSANSDSNALRETVSSFLQGSTIETIELKARLDSLALTEGVKRECDYVLYTTLLRKRNSQKSGGGFDSILGSMGSGMGSKIPGAKKVQDVTSGVGKATGTIGALAKANDEITFEYKLVLLGGSRTVATKSTKAKVKSDGQDVLTPMIEEAAQTIVNVTQKP